MGGYKLTKHAKQMMDSRRITAGAVAAALRFGRKVFIRKAMIFALGKRESQKWAAHAVSLSKYEGIHVVCSLDYDVITVFRNHNFRYSRPRCRAPIHRRTYFRRRIKG